MKKNVWFALVLMMILGACSNSTNTEADNNDVVEQISKSEVFKEILTSTKGDFNGATIGMTKKEVKNFFEETAKSEEVEDFLQYKVSKTYTISDYTFIFEKDKLTQIAADIEVYDEVDNYDSEAAQVLFNDIKEVFLEKYGSKYQENNNGTSAILFWVADNKEIQLIKDFSEVHVYIDALED